MNKPFLLCIGHRGAMGHEPENTLRSISKALELGSRYVEVDIYWVDGRLMVFHDDLLDRTTNGSGPIQEQAYAYLRSLDAGMGECIPTLEEVCEVIDGKAGLNIELKGRNTAAPLAALIPQLVDGGWDKEALLVSSFNHQELFDMHCLDPDLQLGFITWMARTTDLDFAESIGAFSINPSLKAVNAQFIADAHDRGLKVYAYTVNEPEDIERMSEWAVDGVFTNYPERVLEQYSQSERTTRWIGRADMH